MGKTLTSILLVGAAIAINVVPGIGQAISGTIFGALTGAIGTTVGAAAAAAFTVSQVITLGLTLGLTAAGLQSAGSLLGLGPSIPKPDTTATNIKTPRPPRVSGYGRSRLYGASVIYETAADGTAVDVYAVHDGELDAIETHYLADEVVTLTGTIVNQGADGRYQGSAVNIYTTDGSVPGAGIAALETLLPGVWTSTHRGDGVVLLALTAASVKAKIFQETYPQSSPPVPSIVARWQKCPSPAAIDPLDESGWTWTENPVRHLLHYKLVREGPKPALPRSNAGYAAALAALREEWWARKIEPTIDYWIDAAADCDTQRDLDAGGTENRYRSCVVHKHTDPHQGVIAALLATFDGWMAPRADGAYVIYSGRYYAPTVDIGPSEIIAYTWDGGAVDDDQAVNEIVTSYVSAEHDYNTVEADPWLDEADITMRGQVLSDALEAQVPSHAQARALAKRKSARTNAANRGTCTTNIAGRAVRGERFVNLELTEAGTTFFSGPVEITKLTRNISGGVTFEWVEADPDIDDWDPAAEEGSPAGGGDRVPVDPLEDPAIYAAVLIDGPRIELDVFGPDRSDLTWFVHWRTSGETEWGSDHEYSDTAPGSAVLLVTDILNPTGDIEIQVAYQVGDGRFSPWSETETVVVDGIIIDGGDIGDPS